MSRKIIINGKELDFNIGDTILEVSSRNGIYIPTLCYYRRTDPKAICRMCMVEVNKSKSPQTACNTPAKNGMVVETETPLVRSMRKIAIQLMLANGKHDCMVCEANGECTLQRLAYEYGVENHGLRTKEISSELDDSNPFIIRDTSKCVLCGRCIQACNDIQVNNAIYFGYRGVKTKVITTGDKPLLDRESGCVFCGECVQACPVGALVAKKSKGKGQVWNQKKIRTTCPYCGVGCQLWLHIHRGKIVKVTGVETAEPNKGRLCVKGRFGFDFIYSEKRLTSPLIKENGAFREASWDEALNLVASKFKETISKYGPDSVAGVSCSRSINEDSYNMQKLFRSVLKTNNIDNCART
jgi:NADP-reducing hydrogenase subunit HndD